ncbi:MAG: signal peptidase I [Candidatus Omnitrophica bacterium]|nr:signal peptidase I [Candidatus Omnitrophota bacterium]
MKRRIFKKNSVFREWTESIVIAFVLAMFIRAFFIQAFKIPSGSMIPTLIERDRLMVNKLRYGPRVPFTRHKRLPGLTSPERGDVIVFVYPMDPSRDFIKRLVALEGEEVEIKEGDLYIDGALIRTPVIKNIYYYNGVNYGQEGEPFTVPEGHVFVLGDNSSSSSDGRVWGFVPHENIIGRAELIYWPFSRMRFIK